MHSESSWTLAAWPSRKTFATCSPESTNGSFASTSRRASCVLVNLLTNRRIFSWRYQTGSFWITA